MEIKTLDKSAGPLGQMIPNDHEQVVFCQDNAIGLKAIIAIHNTTLGPSLGGTRMWMYSNEQEALNDVLRLSRGMTYKSSISGLTLGGGKAVIIGDSRKHKTEALIRRFGKFVDSLGGKYITAEDVGINPQDMRWVSLETDHVAGLPKSMGGSGDPSPVTAYGVYMGIKASAKQKYGNDSLEGKVILVQGVGHVGRYLVEYLTKENAKVKISDIRGDTLKEVSNEFGAEVIDLNKVYSTPIDIYAPCALGATINDETLKHLTCDIIAGAANNQLASEQKHGEELMKRGIIYAPDFLINAGGVISCYAEVMGYNGEGAMEKAEEIYDTTLAIYSQAEEKGISTYLAANQLAESRIEKVGRVKLSW